MRKNCNMCRNCSLPCNLLIGRQIHCLDCLPYSQASHKTAGTYLETLHAQTRRISSVRRWGLSPSPQVVEQCFDMPSRQMQGQTQNCHCILRCTFSMMLSSVPTAAEMTAETMTVTTYTRSICKEKQIFSSVDSLPCKEIKSGRGRSHRR